MAESPMVGARVPQDWQQQFSVIAATALGHKEAEIIRDVITQYLGKTSLTAVKDVIASLEDKVADLERKLAGNRRLVDQ